MARHIGDVHRAHRAHSAQSVTREVINLCLLNEGQNQQRSARLVHVVRHTQAALMATTSRRSDTSSSWVWAASAWRAVSRARTSAWVASSWSFVTHPAPIVGHGVLGNFDFTQTHTWRQKCTHAKKKVCALFGANRTSGVRL
jgi:hypothetical protein